MSDFGCYKREMGIKFHSIWYQKSLNFLNIYLEPLTEMKIKQSIAICPKEFHYIRR